MTGKVKDGLELLDRDTFNMRREGDRVRLDRRKRMELIPCDFFVLSVCLLGLKS